MFGTILTTVLGFLKALIKPLVGVFIYFKGKSAQRADDMEKELDDIRKAELVRDKFDSDPEFRKRMRDKYTRE